MERFWEAFNNRDLSLLDDLFTEDYVNHAAIPGTPPGSAGQAQVMERLWTAFPDARFEIEHLAQDADTAICVGTMAGTHGGELFGIPGSRQAHRLAPVSPHHDRQRSGDTTVRFDDLGLMRQIGAIPPLPPITPGAASRQPIAESSASRSPRRAAGS